MKIKVPVHVLINMGLIQSVLNLHTKTIVYLEVHLLSNSLTTKFHLTNISIYFVSTTIMLPQMKKEVQNYHHIPDRVFTDICISLYVPECIL